ncbi:MerR family DNA-binding transcriptional regulator [Sphingobacteriales bacterium UPWRP_1]|nr:helix-turn-helix-type transcriptional regulator [Sphingobacteriales bacterium TSM_CSM]PSJ76082.1 MerR family DNA-binding transcriptional regulator [Sphingobacteriales bacterium UPWRP_1]
MAQYSIKDIENLSGIKAHTLRIWEQRYELFKPHRTDTNIRYYTDNDLKLILNVVLLSKQGYRIGAIAKMSEDEIKSNVYSLSKTDLKYEVHITELTQAMIDIDEEVFEKTIATCILQYGLTKTMLNIIYPFLVKIGYMWVTDGINPAQEHFITNLIRQKIIVAIDGQVVKYNEQTKHYLLFLPEGELHEISLLFLTYLLKSRNHRITYLGMSVPLNDVSEAVSIKNPDYLYTIFTSSPSDEDLYDYVQALSDSFAGKQVYISGIKLMSYTQTPPPNICFLHTLEEVMQHFNLSRD